MIKVAGPPKLTESILAQGEEEDFLDEMRLQLLLDRNQVLLASKSAVDSYTRMIHYQIGLCYLMGQGARVDERQGLNYLASAALGGVNRSMNMLTSVHASAKENLSLQMPFKLFLCIAFMGDCTISADILRAQYPQTFDLLLTIRRNRHMQLYRTVCHNESELILPPKVEMNRFLVFDIIEREDSERLAQVLSQNPTSSLCTFNKLTLLHAVSLCSDEAAAEMAQILLLHGASLDKEAVEAQRSWKNRCNFGWGTPLVWSIVKARPKLFGVILDWCAEHQIEPPAGSASLFGVIVNQRQDEMLRKLLAYRSVFVEEGKDFCSVKYQQAALHWLVETNDVNTVMRRWSLGSRFRNARRAIAEILVSMGVDLVNGGGIRANIIRTSILKGDGVCLEVYLRGLQDQAVDLDELLGPNGILRQGQSELINMTALYGSIHAPCNEAFDMLLSRFPRFINEPTSRRNVPLKCAIATSNMSAVHKLLECGAEIGGFNHLGSTVLDAALSYNHVDIARLLQQRCDFATITRRNPVNGLTPFGMVLEAHMSGRNHIGIESFEFLHQIGGIELFPGRIDDDTVWRRILTRGRPILEDHVTAAMHLLQFFLRSDVLGCHVNTTDWTGQAALHYVARSGYVEALELFMDHGARVNQENVAADVLSPPTKGGWTATDFALWAIDHGTPKLAMAGGALEIRSWRFRMLRTLNLLVKRGGTVGSRAPSSHHLKLWKLRDPDQFHNLYISDGVNLLSSM